MKPIQKTIKAAHILMKWLRPSSIGAPLNPYRHIEWPDTESIPLEGLEQENQAEEHASSDLKWGELAQNYVNQWGSSFYLKRLDKGDRQDLLNHWLSLSKEDLRLRFFYSVSKEVLLNRVEQLDFKKHCIAGLWNDEGQLICVSEWAPEFNNAKIAEAAFSTLPEARGLGLAKKLAYLCALDAIDHGFEILKIEALPENDKAMKLALSLGGKMDYSRDWHERSESKVCLIDLNALKEQYHQKMVKVMGSFKPVR